MSPYHRPANTRSALLAFSIKLAVLGVVLATASRVAYLLASSHCSFKQALLGFARNYRPDPAKRIWAASALVRDDPAGFRWLRTPEGSFWVPRGTDQHLADFLGQQADRIYGGGDRGVRPGDIVLDCGANVGVYTRQALRAGAALVVAIEPAPENIECLRRNLVQDITAGRVVVYPKGVWDKDDYLTLYTYASNSGADSFLNNRAGAAEIKAPLTTIDKIVAELALRRVDFVKMDIKGAAPRALAGARSTLAAYHPRIVVSTEEPLDDPKTLYTVIRAAWAGYRSECGRCAVLRHEFVPLEMFYR